MLEGTITKNQTCPSEPVSRRFNREFDSNEIDESDLQFLKHSDPRISTFRGISIDSSDEHEKANNSIRVNREFDSNESSESDLHNAQHDDPRTSTFHGIAIDRSDDSENVHGSIRVTCDGRSSDSD
jgi:hypothetical protein